MSSIVCWNSSRLLSRSLFGAERRSFSGGKIQPFDSLGDGNGRIRWGTSSLVSCAGRETGTARAGRRDTLCHNDLHHLNLVEGAGRLWLVDWEYGGTGDPAFDFASFLCQHDCAAGELDLLRQAYGEHAAPGVDELRAACWVFDYVQWLWYRAWPGGEGADPVYAARADAIERRLRA